MENHTLPVEFRPPHDLTFTVVIHVPKARLEDDGIVRLPDCLGVDDEATLKGCAAALELIDRFGGYFDDEALAAAAARVPEYIVDGFAKEWISRRGKEFEAN